MSEPFSDWDNFNVAIDAHQAGDTVARDELLGRGMTGTATERMPLVGPDCHEHTPNEAWQNQPYYTAAADFALHHLGDGNGQRVLVIGSPLTEVRRFIAAGWRVLHCDIRKPPETLDVFIQEDATILPLADNCVDAVSSTCVLCHAGLGRYGDRKTPNGDLKMLRQIVRVLKPGRKAAIMVGPALPEHVLKQSVVYGNVHRIYTLRDVREMAEQVGLEYVTAEAFPTVEWQGAPEVEDYVGEDGSVPYLYLSVLLRKPE